RWISETSPVPDMLKCGPRARTHETVGVAGARCAAAGTRLYRTGGLNMGRPRHTWIDDQLRAILAALPALDRDFAQDNAAFLDALIAEVRVITGRLSRSRLTSTDWCMCRVRATG